MLRKATIKEKLNQHEYLVKDILNQEILHLRLSEKQRRHYPNFELEKEIYVISSPYEPSKCRWMTSTDFKIQDSHALWKKKFELDKRQTIHIQKLNLAQLPALKALSRQTFSDAFAKDNTPEDMQAYLNTAFNDEQLSAELSNPQSEFYFAKSDEKTLLGYLKINFGAAQTDLKNEEAMEVERIYVLEAFHGQKVGAKLLSYAIEKAKKRNKKYVWLGVWDKNEQAIAFYKKFGFEIVDTHFFRMGEDVQTDYIMELLIL